VKSELYQTFGVSWMITAPENTTFRFLKHGTVRYGTVWCGAVQYSTARHGTVQYSTVQYSTMVYPKVSGLGR